MLIIIKLNNCSPIITSIFKCRSNYWKRNQVAHEFAHDCAWL